MHVDTVSDSALLKYYSIMVLSIILICYIWVYFPACIAAIECYPGHPCAWLHAVSNINASYTIGTAVNIQYSICWSSSYACIHVKVYAVSCRRIINQVWLVNKWLNNLVCMGGCYHWNSYLAARSRCWDPRCAGMQLYTSAELSNNL